MFQSKIRLGTGILNIFSPIQNSIQENFLLDAIEQMGLKKEHIMEVNPCSEDLVEIWAEMKKHGYSTKYQELLEKKINGSKVRSGIYFHN